jgi:alkylation response protein AidB-like acyl-CoA dehydrogenase
VDLELNPRELRFKETITLFIDTYFPHAVRDSPTPADLNHWYKSVAAKGWTAPEWSSGVGGTGWRPMEIFLWYSLTTDAGCPPPDNCALQIVGPLLQLYGNDSSHKDEVKNILNHTVEWGSALFPAETKLSASRSDIGFELDGSLRCFSVHGTADRILVLAATDKGYSLLAVDPTFDGVQLTPDPFSNTASILKLQHVQIPDSCLIGHFNKGLDHLTDLLAEKQSVSTVVNLKPSIHTLKKAVNEFQVEEEFKKRIAEYEIEFEALRITTMRTLTENSQQKLQIVNSRVEKLRKKINESITSALGYYSIPRESLAPGENEPAVSPVSTNQRFQIDAFANCPEGFREDLIARTILGL